MKMKLFFPIVLALIMSVFVGCSKDNNDTTPTNGTIDIAVGTYKGTIKIIGGAEKFDEILIVTKLSDKRIKVKAQNASLNLPDRELDVFNNMNFTVQALATEPQGAFIYTVQNKSLMFLANRTSEGQLEYSFEGIKQ